MRDCVAEDLFERDTLLHGFVQIRSEKAHAVTAGCLAGIKRKVRARKQALGCGAVAGSDCDANRRGCAYLQLLEINRRAQDRNDALCKGLGLRLVDKSGLDYAEFISAEPSYHVLDPSH